MLWIIFLIVIVISYLIYKKATKNNNYFKDRNIAYGKPTFFVGTNKDLMLKKLSLPEFIDKWYNEFPNKKLVGLFDFWKPFFFIRDPDLAKLLCIKEFDHFTDHQTSISEEVDPLLGNILTVLRGKKWRDMRATLSPAFTGNKMRQMMSLVVECNERAVKSLKTELKETGKGILEMKEFFSKFTVDIIASCSFGLEVNSFENPDNDFKQIANKTMNPNSFFAIVKYFLCTYLPKLMKKFDISLLDGHTKEFFRSTVHETMSTREAHGIIRHDMINLLMQSKKGKLVHDQKEEKMSEGLATVEESQVGKAEVTTVWKDDEIVAQCLLFFLAGFDTTSTALGFCGYELALNPDIQQRLRQDIIDMEQSLEGQKLSYDKLQGMKYLDHFVSEILRKWPPAPATERVCNKEFTFECDGNEVTIPKEHSILIAITSMHHDSEYFPNPEKFDPDRFSDENIGNQNMNAYVPFGMGPRNCIASRFALMVIKLTIYSMLLNFSFNVTEKTQIPFKFKKTMINVVAENGTWIELKPL